MNKFKYKCKNVKCIQQKKKSEWKSFYDLIIDTHEHNRWVQMNENHTEQTEALYIKRNKIRNKIQSFSDTQCTEQTKMNKKWIH